MLYRQIRSCAREGGYWKSAKVPSEQSDDHLHYSSLRRIDIEAWPESVLTGGRGAEPGVSRLEEQGVIRWE